MDLQGGPTFEDLSIDDDLTQLQRVVRYSSSSIALQRLVHVKMLAETMAAVGFEQSVKSVVPLIGPLAEDLEYVVRQHLGEQLDDIARFCRAAGKEAGYRLIIEVMLPTLAKLLGDSHPDVRQAAGESLVGVASLMKPLDLGHHVLTIVLQLAHDDEQEELRMTAAALLNDLAEALGNDLCKQFVTPEMESLSEDPVFRVRKATALNLHKICKVVGDAGIQRLLPAYVRLTKDDVYRVRKACADALVEMSNAVGAEASLRELTPVFLNLVSDSSKIVRTVALENLGRLISTLPGESVSEELVRYFTGTAVESMGDPSSDADLRLYCAFSFPAVVVTIGPDRWGELRESFAALLRDPSWSVRKTLSFSLHEVAKVLNPDDVESDLVPAMEAFLRDMEDVRLGVIRHLADFFREMVPPQREKHLNVLVEILQTTSPFNWRLREVLAQQLPRLAPLLTPDSVFFAVVPVAFGLLNDPVAVVRERTFEVVAPLLQLAGVHSSARQASMVARVRELAHANTYQARQMYVYICHSMVCGASATHERPLFVQEFVPSLAELARDSVVNVRIAMSRTLSNCPDWVMELKVIQTAIRHLVKDSNPDVRHFVSFLPPILGHDTSQEDKVPCVDSSSVLSDESMLTQWSVSTQRSMLSVGDFPPVRDASSPNSRSFKLGRQRSSSGESAGESGNSTTSEEGEGLKRLSSRRPPLPAGWGLPCASPVAAAAADGGGGGGSVGGASAETGGKSDGTLSESDGGNPPSEGVAWGAGEAGGNGLAGGHSNDMDNGGGGGGSGREDEVVAADVMGAGEGSPAENEVLSFEREVVREPEEDAPLPPSPKRANSQDSAVIDDDAAAEECPPLTLDADIDGTPLGQDGVSAGVVQEAVMPPTPVPDRAALAAGGLGQGSFVFDFGGDFLDVPQPSQRGELNLTPPPWDGGRIGSGGVFSPPLDMSPPNAPAPVVPNEVKSHGFEGDEIVHGRGEEATPSPGGVGEVRQGDDELGGAEEEKGRGGEKMDDTPLLLPASEELSASEKSTVEGDLVEKKVDVGGELDEETVGVAGESDEELIGVAGKLDEEPVGVAGELEEEIVGVAGEFGDEAVGVAQELEEERIGVAGKLNEEITGVAGKSTEEIIDAAGNLDEDVVGVGGGTAEERVGLGEDLNEEKAGVGGDLNVEPVGLGRELDEEMIGLEGGFDEETVEAGAAATPAASPERGTVSDGSSLCTSGVEGAMGESAGCGTAATETPGQEQEAGRVVLSLARGGGRCAEEQEALPSAHRTQGATTSAADMCVISACMAVGKGLEEAERAVEVDSVDGRGGVGVSEQKSKECGGVEGEGVAGGEVERK